jgi:hypothetical protein
VVARARMEVVTVGAAVMEAGSCRRIGQSSRGRWR